VSAHGAALCSWSVAGQEKLSFIAPGVAGHLFDGATLVPWPNRIRDARYTHGGVTEQLEVTEPERATALHGLATDTEWDAVLETANEVRFRHVVGPVAGYPYEVEVEVSYRLGPSGLSVELHAVNHSEERAPFGAGFHPYLLAAEPSHAAIQIPAGAVIPVDRRLLPTGGLARVDSTRLDYRQRRPVGTSALDTTFGALERTAGIASVRLWHDEDSSSVTLWCDESFPFVHVFSGAPGRIAVEPMTCAPDAFNTGLGLLSLSPGQGFHARWGLTV